MDTSFENGRTAETLRSSGKRVKNDLQETGGAIKNAATDEFKNFVADVEDVIKRVADVSDADVARVRRKIESTLNSAKSGVEHSAEQLKMQAREAAKQADEYVHDSPWQAIGVGAALAAVVGVSVGYLLAARR
jgi:ElaB/YqjD/DUF883 family membrane-anchored ribosome-binding protein